MTKPITVLIVDDSNLIRVLFSDMLSDVPDIKVLDTAIDAKDAREKIRQLSPDVLTLDIEMPGLDGLSFLEKIMSLRPMPVLMVSTLTQRGAAETLRALEIGAVDYIAKPTGENAQQALKGLKDELVEKIRMAAKANVKQRHVQQQAAIEALTFNEPRHPLYSLISIGSSTGGVEALREILTRLPGNLPPIVITQHMPKQFTSSMAVRLDGLSQVTVTEATQGAVLQAGHAYVAPGDQHLRVVSVGGRMVCQLSHEDPVSGHRPSVDVLFESVAETMDGNAVGVILTGMGKDGAAGMRRMRDVGCYTIGQSESTCVVYGMPRAAMMAGGVHSELPLLDIAAAIIASCEQERKAAHGR